MSGTFVIEDLMRQAIALARKAGSSTLPNPRVGAVIFDDNGRILGRGYHTAFGKAHAEIEAMNDARGNGNSMQGASICVTLEPCNHYGKTSPCSKALIDSGIKKVYIGTMDDNSCVCGGGCSLLKESGIYVQTGVLEDECRKINPGFHKYNGKNVPYVNLKIAVSMNGRTGEGKWFTGEKAKERVHALRASSDLIITGLGTIRDDDPYFNARFAGGALPRRVAVLDTGLRLIDRYSKRDLNIVKAGNEVIIVTAEQDADKLKILESSGLKYLVAAKDPSGRVDLPDAIKKLGRDFNSREILIEGGSSVMTSSLLMPKDYIDEVTIFVAPLWFSEKSPLMFNGQSGGFPRINIEASELLDSTVMLKCGIL